MANLCQEGDRIMARNEFKIDGMEELIKTIKRVGQLPQKTVTKAARNGMRIALNAAKSNAPQDSGNLRRGLVLKGERMRVKGKKVYQVTFTASLNSVFVKMYGNSKEKRAYYPASQEFGYTVRGKYTPGYAYLKKSIDSQKNAIENKIISTFTDEFDKLG